MCDHIDWVLIDQEPVWAVALVRLVRSPAMSRHIIRTSNRLANLFGELVRELGGC